MKEVLCVLEGGEPALGGVLLFFIFFVWFVFFVVFCVVCRVSPRGGGDSDTNTAVDEARKTR